MLYGVFLGLAFVIGGILGATSKGEPGIGFRIGYTYLSERGSTGGALETFWSSKIQEKIAERIFEAYNV